MEQKVKNVSPFSNESRNAYVVEHLTSSMLALLEEKPIAEISISELCGMAGWDGHLSTAIIRTKKGLSKHILSTCFRIGWKNGKQPLTFQ